VIKQAEIDRLKQAFAGSLDAMIDGSGRAGQPIPVQLGISGGRPGLAP
jgi:hypothetical protein